MGNLASDRYYEFDRSISAQCKCDELTFDAEAVVFPTLANARRVIADLAAAERDDDPHPMADASDVSAEPEDVLASEEG